MVDIAEETSGIPKKGICSRIPLVVWELWNERNARVFRHRKASTMKKKTHTLLQALTQVVPSMTHKTMPHKYSNMKRTK